MPHQLRTLVVIVQSERSLSASGEPMGRWHSREKGSMKVQKQDMQRWSLNVSPVFYDKKKVTS